MKVSKYRKRWLKYHKGYQRYAQREFMKVFKSWAGNLNLTGMDDNNYRNKIEMSIDRALLAETYINVYTHIGLQHSLRAFQPLSLEKGVIPYGDILKELIRAFIEKYVGRKIVLISQSYVDDIAIIIKRKFAKNLDIMTITEDIHRLVNSRKFYEWQAERIARTEATAAANLANESVLSIGGYEMVKEWVSSHDGRTRRKPEAEFDHYIMDGKQIGRGERFEMRSKKGVIDTLRFPGDPEGMAANVINCRCTIAVVAKRDKNGNLIRK